MLSVIQSKFIIYILNYKSALYFISSLLSMAQFKLSLSAVMEKIVEDCCGEGFYAIPKVCVQN